MKFVKYLLAGLAFLALPLTAFALTAQTIPNTNLGSVPYIVSTSTTPGGGTGTGSGNFNTDNSLTFINNLLNVSGSIQTTNLTASGTINFASITNALGLYSSTGTLVTFGGSTTSGSGNCLTGVTISATGTLTNTNTACSGGGGGGTGNLLAIPTSSILANNVPYYLSNGSANVSVTSTLSLFNTGAQVQGNVTTTNETVSSTLTLTNVTPSGTVAYPISVDGNSFLNIGPITGNSPGSGASGTQEYNIIEQNCPLNSNTSNQSECTFSQSATYPDGTRNFTDWTNENYPGFNGTGIFETATGPSSTAQAFLYPIVMEMSDWGGGTTLQHHLLWSITPVAPTGTWAGATFTQNGNGAINGTETVSGDLSVGTTTDNGNVYISSAGTSILRVNRGANTNYALQVFSTGGVDNWNFGEKNNSTNNFYITDAANGGDILSGVPNGVTTIGNSGSGVGITAATALTASTTLTVASTSDNGLLSVVNASNTVAFQVASTTANNFRFQVVSGTQQLFAVASSGPTYLLGSSTAVTIGGGSLTGGTCTSTTSIVPLALNTSTDVIDNSPQNFPGSGATWYAYISQAGANTSTITNEVCEPVTGTPVATKYNYVIIRKTGL